jgi:hypothetical protein
MDFFLPVVVLLPAKILAIIEKSNQDTIKKRVVTSQADAGPLCDLLAALQQNLDHFLLHHDD